MKNRRLGIFVLALAIIMSNACTTSEDNLYDTKNLIESSTQQIAKHIEKAYESDRIPRSVSGNGEPDWCREDWDWAEGFFPGLCWNAYEVTKDDKFKNAGIFFQNKFKGHRFFKRSHDMGFVFYLSYGKAYELTGDTTYLSVLVEAGETLMERYNPAVQSLLSWSVKKLPETHWMSKTGWDFPVIIDNMMNLELLFELTRITGEQRYHDAAVNHANTTLKNHFREDNSSYHVVDYSEETGELRNKQTAQGFADESAWARGQAWGLYGFTMTYRYTKDKRYLEKAEKIADFLLNHLNLPEDKVPYWDFNAPKIPNEPRDASAAAIIASALIELDGYSEKDYSKEYLHIIQSLSSEKYRAEVGTNNMFILKHSVGSIPHNSEVDQPLVYADYYYFEALNRLDATKTEYSNINFETICNPFDKQFKFRTRLLLQHVSFS